MQGIMYVLNILHYQLCYTSGLHHNLTILLSASLSNLQRIRRNFSGEDVTASKALVCRTPQARHAPPTQDDGHPMPPVSSVCHRRPVIAVSTSSPFCASHAWWRGANHVRGRLDRRSSPIREPRPRAPRPGAPATPPVGGATLLAAGIALGCQMAHLASHGGATPNALPGAEIADNFRGC